MSYQQPNQTSAPSANDVVAGKAPLPPVWRHCGEAGCAFKADAHSAEWKAHKHQRSERDMALIAEARQREAIAIAARNAPVECTLGCGALVPRGQQHACSGPKHIGSADEVALAWQQQQAKKALGL